MSNDIKNVAIFGGSGNVGEKIVEALLNAGFKVTALTREISTATFPLAVTVKRVNYASVASLTEALRGQDAVVSAVPNPGIDGQRYLVDASIAANLKRIIPSEFGMDTRKIEADSALGAILKGKARILDYIQEKAKENPWFTWTAVFTGWWFDWGLECGLLGFDKTSRKAVIFDSGNESAQACNLSFIGKAIAAILARPGETANKYISIASFNFTQSEVLAMAAKITSEKWTVEHASTVEQEKIGAEKLSKGDPSAGFNLLPARLYKDGIGLAVKGPDNSNDLLELQEEDIIATVKAWLGN